MNPIKLLESEPYAISRIALLRLVISETEAIARYVDEYALKRVSTGEDVANAVLFCASDLSRQITGQDIVVDGGWVV